MKRRRPVITVTDHAVVRWLERSRQVDVAAIRKTIADTVEGAASLGATKYSKEGLTYVLDGWTVVTVAIAEAPNALAANHE